MCLANIEIKLRIEPGGPLNCAVAEAIGLTWENATRTRMAAWWHKDGWCYRALPSFGTDLNAAFAAAEKVGLFDVWLLAKGESYWHLQDYSERDMEGIQAPTPALVICAAILHEKEK